MGTPIIAEGNPLLEPHLGLMLWTLITFVIAMVIMYKLAFGRIQEAIDNRRKAIAESVDLAERTRDEAQTILDDYRRQLAEAKTEAGEIIAGARTAGDELSARIKADAETQRQKAIEDTRVQIQAEMDKAMSDLRIAVADMTMTATETVLRGALDVNSHTALIEQAVADLDFDRLSKVGAGA